MLNIALFIKMVSFYSMQQAFVSQMKHLKHVFAVVIQKLLEI